MKHETFIGPRKRALIIASLNAKTIHALHANSGELAATWYGRRGKMRMWITLRAGADLEGRRITFKYSLFRDRQSGRAATINEAIEQLEKIYLERTMQDYASTHPADPGRECNSDRGRRRASSNNRPGDRADHKPAKKSPRRPARASTAAAEPARSD